MTSSFEGAFPFPPVGEGEPDVAPGTLSDLSRPRSSGAQAVTSFGFVVKSLLSSSLRKLRKGYRHFTPNQEYFLMTFFGFLVVGLYFLGKIAKRTRTGKFRR